MILTTSRANSTLNCKISSILITSVVKRAPKIDKIATIYANSGSRMIMLNQITLFDTDSNPHLQRTRELRVSFRKCMVKTLERVFVKLLDENELIL